MFEQHLAQNSLFQPYTGFCSGTCSIETHSPLPPLTTQVTKSTRTDILRILTLLSAQVYCGTRSKQVNISFCCISILNTYISSWFLEDPGTLSMFVPTQLWLAVLEKQQQSGSLSDKNPGRRSSLETCTTCVPAVLPSHPTLCLHPRALPPPTRPTRKHWKGKHTGTAPPSPCWSSLCAARY